MRDVAVSNMLGHVGASLISSVTGIVIVGIIVVFVVVIMLYHACRCSRHHGQRSHQLNHNHYRLAV